MFSNSRIACFVALICLPTMVSVSHAQVTVVTVAGTTNTTTALSGFGTTGDLMVGMSVTAFFDDMTSETAIWSDLGFPAGGASGTGWSLYVGDDTFFSEWELTNASGLVINKITIDAGLGDTVFDLTFGGMPGTDGSALGLDFDVTSGLGLLSILATYRDIVAVGIDPAVGDIYRNLDIEFTSAGGFASGSTLTFLADTDNILFAGDLTPTAVPEPTAYLAWLVIGAAVAVAERHRRRKKLA